jgi:hypothetical protein
MYCVTVRVNVTRHTRDDKRTFIGKQERGYLEDLRVQGKTGPNVKFDIK